MASLSHSRDAANEKQRRFVAGQREAKKKERKKMFNNPLVSQCVYVCENSLPRNVPPLFCSSPTVFFSLSLARSLPFHRFLIFFLHCILSLDAQQEFFRGTQGAKNRNRYNKIADSKKRTVACGTLVIANAQVCYIIYIYMYFENHGSSVQPSRCRLVNNTAGGEPAA